MIQQRLIISTEEKKSMALLAGLMLEPVAATAALIEAESFRALMTF